VADDDLSGDEPPRSVGSASVEAVTAVAKAAKKKAPAKKAPAKRAVATKAVATKAPAAKAVATKAPAKNAPARKAPARKAPAKKAAPGKAAVEKAAPRAAVAKKAVAGKAAVKEAAPRAAPARNAVAKKAAAAPGPDFDPDWGASASTSLVSEPAPAAPVAVTVASPRTLPAAVPSTEKRRPRWRRARRLLLFVVALAALGATVFFVTKVIERSDAGVDYSRLKVGDCIETPPGSEVKGVKRQPCAGPHDAEVYKIIAHDAPPGAPYPGTPALLDVASRSCLGQAFTDYVGRPRAESSLKNVEIMPKASAWKKGRRQIVCAVDTGGGAKLTGSVRGTNR